MKKPLPSRNKAAIRKKRIFDAARRNRHSAIHRSLRLVSADHSADYRPAILLAYHGREVRQMLTATLLRRGYDVTSCDDGRAASQLLGAAHFDLVVTGIIMPNMDGLELIQSLRCRRAPPPVLAVAEEADQMSQIYLRSATVLGATSIHIHPVDLANLLSDVDWILWARADAMNEGMW
jgi:DNA-binding response OmpR family regulator